MVPLSQRHPLGLLEYCISDCDAKLLVTTSELAEKLSPLSERVKSKLLVIDDELVNEAVVRKLTKTADIVIKVILRSTKEQKYSIIKLYPYEIVTRY